MRAAFMSTERAFTTYPEGVNFAAHNAQLEGLGASRRL